MQILRKANNNPHSSGKQGRVYRSLLAVGLLMLMTAVLSGCRAKDNKQEDSNKETVVVGIDQFAPYSYLDENGEYKGVDIELAENAFERLELEPEFKLIDWEDKDDYLAAGDIDCIWSCYSMTDREDKYQWAGPYIYSRQVAAVRSESDIYELADLKDRRVGVQATTKAENLFLQIVDSSLPRVKQVNSFSTTEELFAVLRKGYVDAIAGHEALIGQLVNSDPEAYRMLEESPYVSEIGVAFEKGTHAELSAELSATLEEMKKDGTMAKIVQSYGLEADKVIVGGAADEE